MIENYKPYQGYGYEVTDNDFNQMERKTGNKLPEHYKGFIKKHGLTSPVPDYFPVNMPQGKDVDRSPFCFLKCAFFYGFNRKGMSPLENLRELIQDPVLRPFLEAGQLPLGEDESSNIIFMATRGITFATGPYTGTNKTDQSTDRIMFFASRTTVTDKRMEGSIWLWESQPKMNSRPENFYFCARTLDQFIESFCNREQTDKIQNKMNGRFEQYADTTQNVPYPLDIYSQILQRVINEVNVF